MDLDKIIADAIAKAEARPQPKPEFSMDRLAEITRKYKLNQKPRISRDKTEISAYAIGQATKENPFLQEFGANSKANAYDIARVRADKLDKHFSVPAKVHEKFHAAYYVSDMERPLREDSEFYTRLDRVNKQGEATLLTPAKETFRQQHGKTDRKGVITAPPKAISVSYRAKTKAYSGQAGSKKTRAPRPVTEINLEKLREENLARARQEAKAEKKHPLIVARNRPKAKTKPVIFTAKAPKLGQRMTYLGTDYVLAQRDCMVGWVRLITDSKGNKHRGRFIELPYEAADC